MIHHSPAESEHGQALPLTRGVCFLCKLLTICTCNSILSLNGLSVTQRWHPPAQSLASIPGSL